MSRVADSSFLIALFDATDPRQRQADDAAQNPDPIEVPPEVLAETLGVVEARKGFAVAKSIFEDLRRIPHLQWIRESDPAAIGAIFLHRTFKLSWTDSAVVYWCRRRKASPICFDPDIEAAAKPR